MTAHDDASATQGPRPTAPTVSVLYGHGYDPDVRVRRVTQSLAAAGLDVEILAWDRALAHPVEERDGAVEIRRIRVRSRRGRGLSQVAFLGRVALDMIRHLRHRQPDVIHAVDLPMLAIAVLARALVRGPRPALVYDAFEVYAVMVAHRFPRPVLWAIGLLERRLPRLADLVITPGAARADYFRRRGVPSIVVPNWIDPVVKAIGKAAARSRLAISEDAFCIAYVGAILRSRDLESLLGYAHARPADVILIAGSGDHDEWLAAEASRHPNVRVLGWLAEPSIVLAAADVLYYALRPEHPYAALAAPNNLYVAIANRIPLAYRAQGELAIVGGEHEIGASFTDPESLTDAIDSLRDAATRARVGTVLESLSRRYTWAAAVAPLLEAYPRKGTAASRATANGA